MAFNAARHQMPGAYRLAVALVRPLLMVFTRRDWRGAEHLPREGGFVVAPNHLSHLDPFTLAHFMIDHGHAPRFLGKESVFRLPLAGRIIASADQIPVYRGTAHAAEAFEAAVTAVNDGKCVAILPEATLTRAPGLWPMTGKTGAARVALATRCAVIPIAQWGPQEILEPRGKIPHLWPRKTMHVLAGPPVELSDLYDRPIDAALLREATARIMAAITDQLEQLRGEKGPSQRFDPGESRLRRGRRPRHRRSTTQEGKS